jgi:uncharacterized protein YbbC (DUF1343 family)
LALVRDADDRVIGASYTTPAAMLAAMTRAVLACLGALCVVAGCASDTLPRRAATPPSPAPATRSLGVSPPARAASPGAPPPTTPAPPAKGARASAPAIEVPAIDALVTAAIAEHKLPGCVVAVGRGSGVLFQRAYGQRAVVPAPAPMTEDTIFDLASLSKPVATATAAMVLVERGRLELDAPAARYLPELDRKETRAITVRQLLIHGAGLPIENPLRDYQGDRAQAVAALLAQRPLHKPGTRFSYSDIGYLWLGELVARVAEQPLDAFAREALFAPLGMRDTMFNPPPALLPRIAPTEVTDDRGEKAQLIHGVVHDPRAYRLGGVAGNAGLFSTAYDLSRYARMVLNGGALDGTRVLSARSIAAMTAPTRIGDSVRTAGWDMHSKYSRLRGTKLSERAFGHGGYTGVSLWIDPEQDLFVMLLSNRVHPDAKGNVIGLAGAIADAAVEALASGAECALPREPVRPGIDALRERGFAPLIGKRIGLVTHLAARSSDGTSTLQALTAAEGVTLAAIFSPEHGLESAREGPIADPQRSAGAVPVYSLFGKTRKPTPQMLAGLDALVVDLVDVGTRFYTYMSTLHEVLRAAGEHKIPVIVLDRPNPLGGVAVEGPLLDPGVHTFVNHHRLPVRHGLTAGELAQLMNADDKLGATLTVVPARGFRREMLFADTGLTWARPSPNLPDARAALLYPAIGLLESTNLAVGRGTDAPFQQLGAPWIDAAALSATLERAALPGVRFTAVEFTPREGPYRGTACHGVRLSLDDPHAFEAVRTALTIARALIDAYPTQWEAAKLQKLLGHRATLEGLLHGKSYAALEAAWRPELEQFQVHARQFLLYPRCDSR